MADQHFESGMGGSQGQGAPGNEYGMGTHDKDQGQGGFRNEEGMGAGQISDQGATSRGNEYGMGNEARDFNSSRNEEGLGPGQAGQGDSGNEFGMGSGRPDSEKGMGIIPGHGKHEHKEHDGGKEGKGEGLLKKVEGVFKKH